MKLHCPLPLNNVDLGGTTDDNDISKFRVHYRDTDGFGTLASMAVNLQRFAVGAGGVAESTVVCSWTSDIDGTGATTAAKATKTCAHDLAAEDSAEELRRTDPQLAARAGADLAAGSIEPDVRTDSIRTAPPRDGHGAHRA